MPIVLWAARLERPLTERETAAMLELLPPERRERLLRVRPPERRQEPLCAYFILRRALWEQYRFRSIPQIAKTPRGKPYFPEFPEVHFNLSHTGGAVLVGLAGQPVGVDIERIRPVGSRSMRRIAAADTEEEFFSSWVRREARSKRSGEGIGAMMRSESPLQYGEFYYALDTFPGYAAGVATREKEPPGQIRRLYLDAIL